MTAGDRIAQLEQENVQLRAELAEARQQIAQLADRLHQVEGRLAKDSHNSSKAPSSDGPARPSRSQRKASGKKTGGQAGHAGRTLMQAASPDEVLLHRPGRCAHCQQSLQGVPGQIKECRQVHDLPQLRLLVQEHQVEEVRCPHCQQLTRADFPAGVEAPVQYGPNVRALAVYLHQYQLVPLARTCGLLADLCACHLSEGTLTSWVELAATLLKETVDHIADWLSASRLTQGYETWVGIGGRLHCLHVKSPSFQSRV